MSGSQPPTTAIRGAHARRTHTRKACELFTRGHPAHPPTFARYHRDGTATTPYDGVARMCATINDPDRPPKGC